MALFNKGSGSAPDPKMRAGIYMVVSGYVAYLGYGILNDLRQEVEKPDHYGLLLTAGILFIVFGVLSCIYHIRVMVLAKRAEDEAAAVEAEAEEVEDAAAASGAEAEAGEAEIESAASGAEVETGEAEIEADGAE